MLIRAIKFVAVACLILWATQTALAHDGLKIGIVNLDRVVALSAAGQALQARLEQFQRNIQTEAADMNQALQTLRQRIADQANVLSEEQLAQLQKQYEDGMIEMRRFRDDKQREGQKMQQEGLQEIERQLEPVFSAVRDEAGYDIIMNNVPGVIVMAGQRADITQMVIDRINSM